MPVAAHPVEDLGYDVFALTGAVLAPQATVKARTGIAVEARHPQGNCIWIGSSRFERERLWPCR